MIVYSRKTAIQRKLLGSAAPKIVNAAAPTIGDNYASELAGTKPAAPAPSNTNAVEPSPVLGDAWEHPRARIEQTVGACGVSATPSVDFLLEVVGRMAARIGELAWRPSRPARQPRRRLPRQQSRSPRQRSRQRPAHQGSHPRLPLRPLMLPVLLRHRQPPQTARGRQCRWLRRSSTPGAVRRGV